ncbi:MAG: serine/threonine protein kinase [Acidobacteria bacterium]|nr:serine/threonine protein kinase [Acidobacteriota bacterium]
MTPEQWKQVKLLFEQINLLEPSQEKTYLDSNCYDETVRKEVESLINHHKKSTDFLPENKPISTAIFTDTKSSNEEYFNDLLGTKFNNTYLIEEMIGVGGMGAVFRCTHLLLGNQVAIKIMPPSLKNNSSFVKRFRREARVGWTLSHPNIVKVLEFSQNKDGIFFIVMEYIKAQTLKNYIEKFAPIALRKALEILEPLCSALELAHSRKILHRDIKPANILIGQENGQQLIKLADFGIVKLLEVDGQITNEGEVLTAKETIIGSPNYMSPEQLMNYPLNTASDVYSLGVIFYEMVTGKLPIVANNFQELLMYKVKGENIVALSTFSANLPLELDKILKKALIPAPQNRYQTPKDLLRAITEIL